MQAIKTLNFSINNWGHLYSLQQAISHNNQLTGRKLSLNGRILNADFLNNKDTTISIDFIQSDLTPTYHAINADLYELGHMKLEAQHLQTQIIVDRKIFEELRKNLMEYADIEGIHIMVTIGLLCDKQKWSPDKTLQIVQFDYAMKGDA